MRKLMVLASAVLVAAGGLAPGGVASGTTAGASAPAATAQAACSVTWGSLLKEAGGPTSALVTDVRSGRHECYDRLVVDLGAGPIAGYRVEYVSRVTQDGSGDPVPLAGGAFLQVVVRAWAYDTEAGRPSYDPPDRMHATDVTGYQTFRQVAYAGTFEGDTLVGLGVRARLPFRVLQLTGPGSGSRLVVDVAHQW
jgi:hypothetical protein